MSFFEKYEFKRLLNKFARKDFPIKKEDNQEYRPVDMNEETVISVKRAEEIIKSIQEKGIFSLKTVGSVSDSLS